MASAAKSTAESTQSRDRRERLRAQGLRQIQLWVPDTRSPAFQAEAHRQALAVSGLNDDQAFVGVVSNWS
ncbi:DUF3018 family protein [Methylobacterium sp. WL9]|uniref:DUF3018 family protein n=2 Tax=Methylobacteriaceae TaxID=119045 RepID=A0ABQ4TJ95_9HYPH|nr:antitoxin MazE family protein [Methylobacterium sp. WL9]TXN23887.1 DUF3018 family protein [Methylobacterium sp. WL9]GJE54090.1 hypothetical protein EKPJFOCH_0563 [Methylobacterium thuringiense]